MAAHDPAGGPPGQRQQLTSLNTDCLSILATYLDGADFCRFTAASRVFAQATADARLDLAEADNSRKLWALHFWAVNEQRTRNSQHALQQLLPYFHSCFRREAALQFAGAAAAAQQQQGQQANQQPQPAQPAGQQQGNQQAAPQHQQLPPIEKFQALSAAAVVGGWWQPKADDERCPAAARGFWGCIFLGIFLSLCVEVPNKSQARLVRSLLHIGQPGSLFPDSSSIPVICPLTTAGTAEDPGKVECRWTQAALPPYVRYHAKQFVCAVLVLVRSMVQRPTVAHTEDKAALKQLHFDLQTVLIKLHNDEEDAAIAAAQSHPDEAVWQLANPAILSAAGLPADTVLTAEQYRMCNNAIPDNPREAQLIITVNALAGSGKSSTLRLLQLQHPDKTILYTAYNKAVIEDMKASMSRAYHELGWQRRADNLPLNVDHLTTHVIANEAYWEYKNTNGWDIGQVKGDALVAHLNMLPFFRERQQQRANMGGRHGGGASYGMGWLMKDVLQAFCTSMDNMITPVHLPVSRFNFNTRKYEGLTADEAMLAAQQLWDAFIAKRFTKFTVDFNWYLKAFVLKVVRTGRQLLASNGKLYDIILVDEAQDVNPVTYQLLMSQRCTIMFVGDRRQHIYGFNNAMDALSAAAGEPGRRKKAHTLSHSFRLGDMVAEVANMVLHELGENKQTMIAAGRPQASVYVMPEEPPGLQDPAGDDADVDAPAAAAAPPPAAAADGNDDGPAAAAAAAAAADGEAAGAAEAADQAAAHEYQQWLQNNPPYQQLQLLDEPVPPMDATPAQLQAVRIPIKEMKRPMQPMVGGVLVQDDDALPELSEAAPLFFAVPPRQQDHPDRVLPLMFLSRTNAYWFQVAAGLAVEENAPGRGIRDILSRPPRLYLMAGKPGQANEGSQVQLAANVEFFDKVQRVYRLRYLDREVDDYNPLRRRYTDYESMRTDVLGKKDDVDLKAPITICEIYGAQTQAVLDAIKAVAVSNRKDADFMLGTCHKGKGQEEVYAQLADDFADLGAPRFSTDSDELNLVYVAITRAMLGLVCNRNVAQLLTEKSRKRMELEVQPPTPEDEEREPHRMACGCCHFQFDLNSAVADTVGRLVIKFKRSPEADALAVLMGAQGNQGDDGEAVRAVAMCTACVRNTLFGQLVEQHVPAREEA